MARAKGSAPQAPSLPDLLGDLEERVRAAAGRIRELREEKGALESRIQDLEQQLAVRSDTLNEQLAHHQEENAALRRRVEELETRLADAPGTEDAELWERERREVRERVERLVRQLEELMAD